MQASALLRSRRFPEQPLKSRSVKDEIRVNLIALLREGKPIFRGVIGYDAGRQAAHGWRAASKLAIT